MTPGELLQELVDVAGAAGLVVRAAGRADAPGAGEPAPSSAACRVRDQVWVVLCDSDPLEVRIDALARALRDHAGPWLETHYVAPALRARLGDPGGDPT